MLEDSQYENWMTFDAGCRPGEALKEASRYVGRNGEVGQRNTIVWCGESTAGSGYSFETNGNMGQIESVCTSM